MSRRLQPAFLLLLTGLVDDPAHATPRRERTETPATGAVNGASGAAWNGAWRIEAATAVGNCPGLIPPTIDIVDGRIAQGAQGEAWGHVEGGVLVARFTTGGHVARLHGNLRGGEGSGAWSSSTDLCGGTWRAERDDDGGRAARAPAAEETQRPQ